MRRFEFLYDSEFSAKKVKIDRNGTRVRSLKLGRVISPDTIDYKLGSKRRHFFQYRIEKMSAVGETLPGIIFGLCLEDFQVNTDLDHQKNVWCLNSATGQIFTDKQWKNYVDWSNNPVTVGTVLGI